MAVTPRQSFVDAEINWLMTLCKKKIEKVNFLLELSCL